MWYWDKAMCRLENIIHEDCFGSLIPNTIIFKRTLGVPYLSSAGGGAST